MSKDNEHTADVSELLSQLESKYGYQKVRNVFNHEEKDVKTEEDDRESESSAAPQDQSAASEESTDSEAPSDSEQ
ncbi:hypothetical protein [Lactobacillus selangorensis]|nr:hypothetical protein [Lactobacillus selangorensis]